MYKNHLRLIGLTKTALPKVLGKAFVTLPVLQTLIVEIEAVLNDRPLMYFVNRFTFALRMPDHISLSHRITDDEVVNDPTHGAPPVSEVAR